MTIYLDVFILKNFIFNFLIIFICGKLLRVKVNLKKYILSSIIGTLYALVALMTNNFIVSYFFKFFIGMLMVIVAYPIISLKQALNNGTLFILSVSFIGGNIVAMNIENKFVSQLIGFLTSSFFLFVCYKAYQNRNIFENLKCNIKIELEGNVFEVDTFIDTGNTLRDEITGESVIFVYEDKLKSELSEEIIKILKGEVFNFDEKYFGKIKMLSYKSINNKSNVIIGIKVESVFVEKQDYNIKNDNVILAISKTKFNGCEALIGLNILEEGYIYGNSTSFKNESKKIME